MTLTDTAPVLRPSVRGTEELAAIGRSVTGRECLKTVPCAGTAVLVGGPIAKHGSPIAPELGDMGR